MPPSTDKLVVFVGVDASAGWYWQRETSAGVVVNSGRPLPSQAAAQQAGWDANTDLHLAYPKVTSIPVRTQNTLH